MLQKQGANALHLFSTPVILHDIDNAAQINTELKALILARRESDAGLARSNHGGWHSQNDMTIWAEQQARFLLGTAIKELTPYTADICKAGKRDFTFDAQMWANINTQGNSNQMHCHSGALWSGVYYVDAGEDDPNVDVEGELMLQDPRFPMNSMYMPDLVLRNADNTPQHSQFAVRPVNGRMVLFPAWLFHSVRPYTGTGERISIAFNLMVEVA